MHVPGQQALTPRCQPHAAHSHFSALGAVLCSLCLPFQSGSIGPFISWPADSPDLPFLTIGSQQFLGDPNVLHTFTGSPLGQNFVKVSACPWCPDPRAACK